MNTTVARCGHSVAAVGAPGSEARLKQRVMLCKICAESQEELFKWLDSHQATPVGIGEVNGVGVVPYTIRGVLTYVLKYDDGSWDILMPCSNSVKIGDTLKAATDHLKRLAS